LRGVLTFIGFLEELERNHQTVVIPGEEVERLVKRFGPVVRQIGLWQHEWIRTDPEVPDGAWWKDFGSFKLAGESRYPKTFLTRDQPAFGQKL
jgi:hypothetical protein